VIESGKGWDCHVHVFDRSAAASSGHYQPVDRPLAQIEAVAEQRGVHHLVLVQPSVYGVDNSLLLQALRVTPGRHRGVVVLGDRCDEAELEAMHACGVRGARLNLVSPVGEGADVATRFKAIAPRLRRHGWHMQWYARPEHLVEVARLHCDSGVTCVLDHLAGFGVGVAAHDPAWGALSALAQQGAWIKLSGWYRLGASEPYAELLPQVRRVCDLFGERIVWGSDWPHTSFAPDSMPSYGSTWRPVDEALGREGAERILRRAPSIYV
jgi:predicted TIM-barrel fold metal-dependent hydrolase